MFLVSTSAYSQGILSEQQIGDFRTRWLDPQKKKNIVFFAGFEQLKLDPRKGKHDSKIKSYKRTGKVPCWIWCNFGEIWEYTGGSKSPELLMSQPVYFYVKDSNGRVVYKDSSSVGKVVRRGSTGGIYKDLPKADTYTCVIYVRKEKMLFGKEITVTFQGYK